MKYEKISLKKVTYFAKGRRQLDGLTHFSLKTPERVTGKQCRPRMLHLIRVHLCLQMAYIFL